MTKKKSGLYIFLFTIIFALMLPSFARRIHFENKNCGIVLSLDYNRLEESFNSKEIPKLLEDAKNGGIHILSVNITNENELEFSNLPKEFELAAFIDSKKLSELAINTLKTIADTHNLKYINLRGDFANNKNGEKLARSLGKIINKNKLVLVFSETKDQTANDVSKKEYNILKTSANGALIRCYDTSFGANSKINPGLRFHQMLNSLKDRNTHFINLVPFEDKTAPAKDNYYAMLEAVSLFTRETKLSAYPSNDFRPDYSGYNRGTSFILILSVFLSVLLWLMVCELLFKKMHNALYFLAAFGFCFVTVFVFAAEWFAELVCPFILAVSSACFLITLIFYTIRRFSQKGFLPCLLASLFVSLAGFFLRGYSISTVLSGADYYLYFKTFRGVKLSLALPVVYAVFAYVKLFGFNKIEFINFKTQKSVALFAFGIVFFGLAAYLYILRSGNTVVSSLETNLRNSIDVLMGIRPRTKEFLIGWPSLWLFVWYKVNTKQNLVPFALAIGTAVLASSVINSFCHVFTPCISIYHRTFNGFILGMPISLAALILNLLIIKFLNKKRCK